MPRAAKVSISLPEGLLRQADRLRRRSGESRSQLFRRAAEELLRDEQRHQEVRRYLEGYRRHPERAAETAAYDTLAAEALADLPWDPEVPAPTPTTSR